jgi:indole-3-glycerol phosphate synthase
MIDSLRKILAKKAERLEAAMAARPLAELERLIANGRPRAAERFRDRLARPDGVNVIAEVKRASPSKGVIRADLDPVDVAAGYAPYAAAISVLTEEDFFQGSLDVLRRVRERVDVPLLRKDFVFDRYQLFEAAEAGADAVLLIVAALEPARMRDLAAEAAALDLDVLVEVHTPQEMETVLDWGHSLVGVNNRNLKTFEVDVETSYRIATMAPETTLLVSESGIETRGTIDALRGAGFAAFLIGEHFMRAPVPGEALRALVQERR